MSLLLTDAIALIGIDLVLCGIALRLAWRWVGVRGPGDGAPEVRPAARWLVLILLTLLWWPAGKASLPLLGYVRGVTADFSVTLVAITALGMLGRLWGRLAVPDREGRAVWLAVATGAVLLYPAALGWGDVDTYRAGWGSLWMLAALMGVAVLAWWRGFWLLPGVVALSVLAWCGGLMESRNLWDYLIDPWLAIAALVQVLRMTLKLAWDRVRPRSTGGPAS